MVQIKYFDKQSIGVFAFLADGVVYQYCQQHNITSDLNISPPKSANCYPSYLFHKCCTRLRPAISLHKGAVTRNLFSFDDVIMEMQNEYKALNLLKAPLINYRVSIVGILQTIYRFITTLHCFVSLEAIYGRKPQVMNIRTMCFINHHCRLNHVFCMCSMIRWKHCMFYNTRQGGVRRAAKGLCAHKNVVLAFISQGTKYRGR